MPDIPAASHTPGPWHRCEAQPDAIVGPLCDDPCEQCDRAQLSHYDDEGHSVYLGETYGEYYDGHFVCESVSSRANFNLIAAAPKMLTMLIALSACVDSTEPCALSVIRLSWPTVEALDSLIAEAQGQES